MASPAGDLVGSTFSTEMKREEANFQKRAIELTIRIGFLLLLVAWCFWIIMPFAGVIIWGMVIAVSVYPMHRWLESAIGNRRKWAAVITTLALLVLFIAPAATLTDSLFSGAQGLYDHLAAGDFKLSPPPEGISSWPVIGEPLDRFWRRASTNIANALQEAVPYLTTAAGYVFSAVAGIGLGLIQFLLATIFAGVLLANAEGGRLTAERFTQRIAGDRGTEFARVAKETIRSVARGILGVALIQSILAGIGFLLVGLPAAGFLALICLFLSVIQVGVGPVMILAVIYVFYTSHTFTAVVFLIWCLAVTLLDNLLKPILLGRGAPVPTMVIFLGAIGGFLTQGILGLFLGAVILSLGFNLYQAWVNEPFEDEESKTVEEG
jgi:predicted PurR-regulated permease PerM